MAKYLVKTIATSPKNGDTQILFHGLENRVVGAYFYIGDDFMTARELTDERIQKYGFKTASGAARSYAASNPHGVETTFGVDIEIVRFDI